MPSSDYQQVNQIDDSAWESQPRRDLEDNRGARSRQLKKSCLAITSTLLFLLFTGWLFIVFTPSKSEKNNIPALSLEEYRNSTYIQRAQSIEWLPNGKNGEFIRWTHNGYEVASWESQEDSKVVAPWKVDYNGTLHYISKISLNQQKTHALLTTDTKKHWRHSTFSRYWIYDVKSTVSKPLSDEFLSVASWSPDGLKVSYVLDNNVFVYDIEDDSTDQVTYDGGADVFNGIPDWVYEEEVFAGPSAIWWSPESKYLAYMRTNDSLVPKFPIPYFLKSDDKTNAVDAYPSLVEIKYPKPGFPNPSVEIWLYSTVEKSAKPIDIPTTLDEPIISEVIWVGEKVVVKLMNRESDFLEVWIADKNVKSVFRSRSQSSKDQFGSWFEVTHNSHAVGADSYIDTVDVNGYNHLGLFSPANASEPIILTKGNWEVQDTSIAVNDRTRYVYFHAAKRSSMEISLYRVSLDHPDHEVELVAFEGDGIYSADFSADASFALVSYTAPDAPLKQKVVKLNSEDTSTGKAWVVEENKKLRNLLESRNLLEKGNVVYGSVNVGDGISVNYREIRPVSFDSHKKYPLLFFNYGGPGSQQVLKQLTLDFQRIFAETHDAIVVTVDPRGTGNKGRKFRASVRDHLGDFEADDVISVAKIWNEKAYIDSSTTAIWGWSYGGFLTLKTLERDTDLAFKYGVAVAPVTDWSLYDSIYTERYMHKPDNNPHGYEVSGINNITNIAKHERFLVMHGTGDDNVHFQNTLKLLDKLDLAGVDNYDVHVFPDSDHSIYFHNANKIVYNKIDQWLKTQQQRI